MQRPSAGLAIALVGLFFSISAAAFGANDNPAQTPTPAPVSGSSTMPISLPERLGSFEDYLTVIRRRTSARTFADDQRMQRDTERLTVAAYRAAYGGAATAFREYSDTSALHFAGVIAVRAPSPGLTAGPVTNPADLGLAANEQEVHVFGDVACVVETPNLAVAGRPINPSSRFYPHCQRSGPDLTVSVFLGNAQGTAGRRDAVELTDSAYRAVAGG